MSVYRTRKVVPRNGHTLVVLIVARISGCQSQKDVSLDDQEDHGREVVKDIYDGDSVEFRIIKTTGKGESLDRPELLEIQAMIRTRDLDLLIVEDLGRLVRGTAAKDFCGLAVDHDTRVIAPNDFIDTDEASWEEDVIAACRDHVGHNSHTSKRLKKKMMLRFARNGECTSCPIVGFEKPAGSRSYHDWKIDAVQAETIRSGAKRLLENANCSAIADYFNHLNFPVGPYCRKKEWDGKMVRRLYSNPLLKGKPQRGKTHTVKHHGTGRRRSVKNPEGATLIDMPHLAILSELEFDELNAILSEKNAKMGRKKGPNGRDRLAGVQRKQTRFPGQHLRCWYCGNHFVWSTSAGVPCLHCNGARRWECWTGVGVNGARVTSAIVSAITQMLFELDGFETQFRKLVDGVCSQPDDKIRIELQQITNEEAKLNQEEQNLLEVITQLGFKPFIADQIQEIESKRNRLTIRKAEISRLGQVAASLPRDLTDLKKKIEQDFLSLALDSYELGAALPRIVPAMHVHSVSMCDDGPPLPRLVFKIDLTGSFESDLTTTEITKFLQKTVVVDLFDLPVREKIRARVMKMVEQGLTHRKILELLPETTSLQAIADAVRLDHKMKSLGLLDPLVVDHQPGWKSKRYRKHLHPRYSFKPVDGYCQPPLA